MHLTILTADLLAPLRFAAPVPTPNLDKLLSRASVTTRAGGALEDVVLSTFNKNESVAFITASLDLPNDMPNKDVRWLRADPVHLAVSRDNIQLFDSHIIKPTLDEMMQIASTLNQHFAHDGIENRLAFMFPDAARGYFGVKPDDLPETTPLWQMGGANVFDHLPRQRHGLTNWRRVSNEIQMLLHDHPVNIAREASGQYPINGLWIWGESGKNGTNENHPHARAQVPHQHLIGRLALARGLAQLCGMSASPLPEQFEMPAFQNSLIVLHTPTREIRAMSPYQWQIEVNHIDNNWLAPAVAALDDQRLTSLTVIIANEASTLTINAKRKSLVQRFFPNKKTLADYA